MPKPSFYLNKHRKPGRRIGGAGGGSERGPGRGTKNGAGMVTAVVIGAAAAGGGIGGTSVVGSADTAGSIAEAGTSPAFHSQAGPRALRELRARTDRASSLAKKGNRRKVWREMRLRRSTKRRAENAARCVGFSHGHVRDFFTRNHCRSLRRELFGLVGPSGNTIVVSVVRIRMRSPADVRRLRDLIDVHGTGDVYPLGSALLGLGDITFTGRNYGSRPVGRTLVVAETEPASGTPSAALLDSVAEVAARLPK